jgi:hypothetical protein
MIENIVKFCMAICGNDVKEEEVYRYATMFLLFILVTLMPFVSFREKVHQCADDNENKKDHVLIVLAIQACVAAIACYAIHHMFKFFSSEINLALSISKKPEAKFDESEYFYYRIDYLFSRFPNFKILCLLFVTTILITIGAVFVWLGETTTSVFRTVL